MLTVVFAHLLVLHSSPRFRGKELLKLLMFLQLQHSLEAQIAALVRNLQVLQQNHDRQQEIQDKEKAESKLQQQIEERLKRLEDLQTKMLEAQVCKFISHLPLERGRVWYGVNFKVSVEVTPSLDRL